MAKSSGALKNEQWFKFYYLRILVSCKGWKDDEFGAYVKLLIHQFDKGYIPNSEKELKKIFTTYKKNWEILKEKFPEVEPGKLINEVMQIVRDEYDEKKKKGKEFGLTGGRPPKKENPTLSEKEPEGFEKETHKEKEKEEERENTGALAFSNLNRKPYVPTKQQVFEAIVNAGGDKVMAKSFYEKHQGTGWYINGSPIVDYTSLASRFVSTWKELEKGKTKTDENYNPNGHLKPLN